MGGSVSPHSNAGQQRNVRAILSVLSSSGVGVLVIVLLELFQVSPASPQDSPALLSGVPSVVRVRHGILLLHPPSEAEAFRGGRGVVVVVVVVLVQESRGVLPTGSRGRGRVRGRAVRR